MRRAWRRPCAGVVLLALVLAGCSGRPSSSSSARAGEDAAAVAARVDARADSAIAAKRAVAAPDDAATAEIAGALGAWLDGVRQRDPAFTPDSFAWQPERRLASDPGMRLTAAFFDTLQRGSFGLIYGPDGTLAVDPQFRRFFEDENARFSIMADPMVTVFEFPARRRHVIDTGIAAQGDVFESVAWLGPHRIAVGGWLRMGARNAPAVRVYDLDRTSVREALAPALAAAR